MHSSLLTKGEMFIQQPLQKTPPGLIWACQALPLLIDFTFMTFYKSGFLFLLVQKCERAQTESVSYLSFFYFFKFFVNIPKLLYGC